MHTADAIRILKERVPYIHSIEPIGKNLYKVSYAAFIIDSEEKTARKLIKWARVYTSENKGNSVMKRSIKHYDHKKNRTATRDIINTEEFERIPQNGKVAEENPWNWD